MSAHTLLLCWSDQCTMWLAACYVARAVDMRKGQGCQFPPPHSPARYHALMKHPIEGQRVAVFGTETPWVEAILFGKGEVRCEVLATYAGTNRT